MAPIINKLKAIKGKQNRRLWLLERLVVADIHIGKKSSKKILKLIS